MDTVGIKRTAVLNFSGRCWRFEGSRYGRAGVYLGALERRDRP